MSVYKAPKTSPFFIRTYVTMTLILVALVALYNISSISMVLNTTKHSIIDANSDLMANTAACFNELLEQIKNDAMIIAEDPNVINATLVPAIERNARNSEIVEKLQNIVENNAFIRSIQLYVPLNDFVISSDRRIGKAQTLLLDDLNDSQLQPGNVTEKSQFLLKREGPGSEIMYFYYNFPKEKKYKMGRLRVEVDVGALKNAVLNQPIKSGGFFIINGSRELFFNSENEDLSDTVANYVNDIWAEEYGYRTLYHEGHKYFFFHATSSVTGWKLVNFVNSDQLFAEKSFIYSVFLPLTVFFLSVCCMVTYLISKQLYDPMRKLVKLVPKTRATDSVTSKWRWGDSPDEYDLIKNSYLQMMEQRDDMYAKISQAVPMVEDMYYQQMLRGDHLKTDWHSFYDYMLDLKKLSENQYAVIIFQFGQSGRQEDMSALNKLVILQLQHVEQVVFNTEGLHLVVGLLSFAPDQDSEQGEQLCLKIAQDILSTTSLPTNGQVGITVGISRLCRGNEEIHSAYEQARTALQARFLLGNNRVISARNVQYSHNPMTPSVRLFFDEEIKKVVNAVSIGDAHAAQVQMDQFFASLQSAAQISTEKDVVMVFSKLLDCVEKLETGPGGIDDARMVNKPILSSLETFEELREFVRASCLRVSDNIQSNAVTKNQYYVNKALSYVANNYSDSNISLSSAAEYVGISSAYLSKLFKTEYPQRFTAYVANYRVNKAKQLLAESESIKVTAKMVGFSSAQSFIRVFKKVEGITPGQYSEQIQKSNGGS